MKPRVALVLLVFAAACDQGSVSPGAVVRDSAGVRIVEYSAAPEPARTLRLVDQPLYRHGSGPADVLFARVQWGALRPDGSAVVVDIGGGPGAQQEIVELIPDGSVGAVLARGGQGPEEVRSVLGVHVVGGDSLLVEDDGNAKLMVFSGETHAYNVSLAGRPDLGRALRVHGTDVEGKLLMLTSSFSTDFTVPWLQGSMVRLDQATLVPDTVARYDMAARRDREGPNNPFGPAGVATESGGRFVYLRTDVPEITWRAPDGRLEQVVRWNPPRLPITEEFVVNFKETYRGELVRMNPGSTEQDPFIEQALSRIDVPPGSVLPITQTISGDDRGRVWLPEYMPTTGFNFYPSWYEVVDGDGTWLGTVTMPPKFRLLDIAYGRVLGVQLDALDVEHVVVYELIEG